MAQIKFVVPKDMDPVTIAETFNTYLLGSLSYKNTMQNDKHRRNGPYRKEEGNDNHWQLDNTNDFWLHVEGSEASVSCRYPGQKKVVEAMVNLFNLRYR